MMRRQQLGGPGAAGPVSAGAGRADPVRTLRCRGGGVAGGARLRAARGAGAALCPGSGLWGPRAARALRELS